MRGLSFGFKGTSFTAYRFDGKTQYDENFEKIVGLNLTMTTSKEGWRCCDVSLALSHSPDVKGLVAPRVE